MYKDFSGKNLHGRSFKSQNLEGANFSGADIRGANFTNANLQGANFSTAKAGLHKQWTIVLLVVSWLVAGIFGFLFSTFTSDLIVKIFSTVKVEPAVDLVDSQYPQFTVDYPNSSFYYAMPILIIVLIAIIIICQGVNAKITLAALAFVLAFASASSAFTFGHTLTLTFTCIIAGAIALALAIASGFALAIPLAIASNIDSGIPSGIASNIAAGFATLASVILSRHLDFVSKYVKTAGSTIEPFHSTSAKTVIISAIVIFVSFSIYIARQVMKENEKYTALRRATIVFSSFGGTSFRNANLTDADFSFSVLKSADFRKANLVHTCFEKAKKLSFVRPGSTYLKKVEVVKVLVTKQGQNSNFDNQDLRGVNFQGAYLQGASFVGADLSNANLQDADLSRAKLEKTLLNGTDFTGATLSGAHIYNCKITSNTNLTGVQRGERDKLKSDCLS